MSEADVVEPHVGMQGLRPNAFFPVDWSYNPLLQMSPRIFGAETQPSIPYSNLETQTPEVSGFPENYEHRPQPPLWSGTAPLQPFENVLPNDQKLQAPNAEAYSEMQTAFLHNDTVFEEPSLWNARHSPYQSTPPNTLPYTQPGAYRELQISRPNPSLTNSAEEYDIGIGEDISGKLYNSDGYIKAETRRHHKLPDWKQHPPLIRHIDGKVQVKEFKFSEWEDCIPLSAIREELLEWQRRAGKRLKHPDLQGKGGKSDKTAYHPLYAETGPERTDRCLLLFQFDEVEGCHSDVYPGLWRYNDLVVTGVEDKPLYDFEELPKCISSEISGARLEEIIRRNPDIQHQDMVDRFPAEILSGENQEKTRKKITNFLNTINMRQV